MEAGAAVGLRYGPVPGVEGLEALEARDLRLQYDRHFHDTYALGIVLRGVERCRVGRALNFYEPGTVPMFNPGEVHDGGPATGGGWTYRMVYVDPALVAGERTFPRQMRRDAKARETALQLFDAIDCGSVLGIEEALESALDTLLDAEPAAAAKAAPRLDRVREHIDAQCCEPRRVAKARRMIAAGVALAEVAAACGYADQSHLNRWFFRVHGTTPGRFRRAFLS